MTVLTIIGVLIGIYLLVELVKRLNEYTKSNYSYKIFDERSAFISAVGYVMVYVGQGFYFSAIADKVDTLDGELLVLIGALFLSSIIAINFRKMGFLRGLSLSVIQMIIYAGVSVVAVFALIAAYAFFSQTRPVYNINR